MALSDLPDQLARDHHNLTQGVAMKSRLFFGVSTIVKAFGVLACFLITGAVQAGYGADFQVLVGAVKFLAVTNISALTIHGQSNRMTATRRPPSNTSSNRPMG